jgi:hypothetical protein
VTKKATPTEAIEGEVITADEAPTDAEVVSEATDVAVVDNSKALNAIARRIRTATGKGHDALFSIGHALNEARALIPGDREFGAWVASQEFAFSRQTAYRLQQAALREPEVRQFIADSTSSRDISPQTAVEYMTKQAALDSGEEASDEEKATGKRVRDLIAEDNAEPASAYPAFKAALEALNLQVLTVEELTDLAGDIQSLAVAYKAEKTRRSA